MDVIKASKQNTVCYEAQLVWKHYHYSCIVLKFCNRTSKSATNKLSDGQQLPVYIYKQEIQSTWGNRMKIKFKTLFVAAQLNALFSMNSSKNAD